MPKPLRPTAAMTIEIPQAIRPQSAAMVHLVNVLNAELPYVNKRLDDGYRVCQLRISDERDTVEMFLVAGLPIHFAKRRPGWRTIKPADMPSEQRVPPVYDVDQDVSDSMAAMWDRERLAARIEEAIRAFTKQPFKKGLPRAVACALIGEAPAPEAEEQDA